MKKSPIKKILAFALCIITLFAVAACGKAYDDTALLNRISQLEKELADAKANAIKGDNGLDGESGLSTYEIFVKYNPEYEGDEEQWIDDFVNGMFVKYTISYTINGVLINSETPNEYKKSSQPITLWTPSALDYPLFDGWYQNADYSGQKVTQIPANTIGNKEYFGKFDVEPQDYDIDKIKAPDFEYKDLNDNIVKLSDYYGIKPVFICFWAAWDSRCTDQFDIIKSVYQEMSDKVEILAIEVDGSAVLSDFLKDNTLDFPILVSNIQEYSKSDYHNSYIPANYMVDKWGYLYKSDCSESIVTEYNLGAITAKDTMKGIISDAIARGNA